MSIDKLVQSIEDDLEQTFAKARKLEPGGSEIPEILAKFWFQLQRLNVELARAPADQKMDVLERLQKFVKKLLENLRKVAPHLGVSSFSIGVSQYLSVQVTLTWQLSPVIVA